MSSDWIKMRVWIRRDPKVIAIADHLAADPAFRDWFHGHSRRDGERDMSRDSHGTRGGMGHVTECVTVTGLLQVWGVTRRDGVCEGEDVFLAHATLDTLDRIADIPGIGRAMHAVGWAEERPGEGVIFPKLLLHITSPDERRKEMAAARKKRQRDRERDMSRDSRVTGSVTVTDRGEEKRVDKNSLSPNPSPSPADAVRERFGTESEQGPAGETTEVAATGSDPAPGDSAKTTPIGQPRAANAILLPGEDDSLKADDRLKKGFLAAWNGSGLRNVEKRAFGAHLLGFLKQRLTDDYWREQWEAAVAKAGKDPFYAAGEGRGNAGPLDVAEFLKNEDLVRRILSHVPGKPRQPEANHGKPPVVHQQDEY